MLKYIIEVYFLRKVSSTVIRLQRSPPYTGCLPRNDHLLKGSPLYTGHLPMNCLFFTTATPSQWHIAGSVSVRMFFTSITVCLFVCLFCFVFSNLFIFIVIVIRCHHKHLWRVGKLKPSVRGAKYSTLDLDFLQGEFIVNILK